MNENVQFWDEVFDELDVKYVDEASEKLFRHQGEEKKLVEIVVDNSSDKPRSKWRSFTGIAAAVVLGIGGIGVVGGLITGGFSALQEKTLDFDIMELSAGEEYREVEITPDSENADKARELLELIENMTFAETLLDVSEVEDDSFYGVLVSLDGEITYNIKLGKKFTGADKHYYRISDNIVTEISKTEYERAEELIIALTEEALPVLKSGTYFSNEVDGSVYVTVTGEKIELCGEDAYAFASKYGGEPFMQNESISAEIDSHKEQIFELRDEYDKVYDEAVKAQEQLSILHDEYDTVSDETAKAQEQLSSLYDGYEGIDAVPLSELRDYEMKVDELRQEQQDILSEIRAYEVQIDELRLEQQDILSEIRVQETQLNDLNTEQAVILNEASVADQQLDKLYNELNSGNPQTIYRADITSYIVMLKDGEDSGEYVSYFNGGNTIYVFGIGFKYAGDVKQAQFDSEYKLGHICFTDVVQANRLSSVGVASPFENETEAEEYFAELTGYKGISRLSDTVNESYELNLEKSRYDSLAESYDMPREVSLCYKNENDAEILISAVETDGVHQKLRLPDGTVLEFPENTPDMKITTLLAADGRTIELKTGGVYFAERYYLLAEWSDNGMSYCVSTSKCYIWDFINTLIAIVVDADGKSDVFAHCNRVVTSLDSYEMKFGSCFSNFIGFWSDGTEEIEIGANDNLFSYGENQLYGFYEDESGYYMSGSKGVWFIPANDKASMYYYVTATAVSDAPRTMDYNKKYHKTSTGDMSMMDTNRLGVIGMHEFCYHNGIDYDSLYDFSFTDENGRAWYRVQDRSVDWGDMYVDNFSGEIVFLKMKSGDEMKYFSCRFKKIGGEVVMTDEHYPYDVSVLTFEGLPTELSERYYVERGTAAYDEMGLRGRLSVQFYPLSDGSYYAIRAVGHNQSQFVNGYEIFYNDGNGYSRVDGTFEGFLGTFFHEVENDRIYALHTKESELPYGSELVVSCISGDKITASLSLGEEEGFVNGLHVHDGILSFKFWVNNTIVDKLFIVDFTDIYNPVLNEIRVIVEGASHEYQPLEGYSLLSETGEKLPDDSIKWLEYNGQMYYAPYVESQCGGFVDNIAYNYNEVIIIGGKDNEGIKFTQGDIAEIKISPDFSANYNSDTGEVARIGYIYDGCAESIYTGIIPPDGLNQLIEIEESGRYKFYIVNLSNVLQNYRYVEILGYSYDGIPMGYNDISKTGAKLSADDVGASAEIDRDRMYQDIYSAYNISMADGESVVLTDHDYMPYELKAGDKVTITLFPMIGAYYSEKEQVVSVGIISDTITGGFHRFISGLEVPAEGEQYVIEISVDGDYKFVVTNKTGARVNFTEILVQVPIYNGETIVEKLCAFNEGEVVEEVYGESAMDMLTDEIGGAYKQFPLDEKYRADMQYFGRYYCPAEIGEQVCSMTDGTVAETGCYSGFGHSVLIEFEENRYLLYHHLGEDIPISVGDEIMSGDIIGYVGTSGFAAESALGISVYDMPEARYGD